MTLANNEQVAVLGNGFCLPPTIRTNDDPIFDDLHKTQPAGSELFKGYVTRRVLAPGESLTDLMTRAASVALEQSRLDPTQIDLLLGYESVSDFIEPNGLALLHHKMSLPERCMVLPINDEYTNSLTGMIVADALIRSTRARNAIIVVGCNWTQYSNYTKPQSFSSGDGAGAVVLGANVESAHFAMVDHEVSVQLDGYGGMRMQAHAAAQPGTYTKPWSDIDADGVKMFLNFAKITPPAVVNRLLDRNGIKGSDITLIPYQASSVLLDPWREAIQPAQLIESIADLANMTLATVLVNFARQYDAIQKDWVCLLGVGTQFQSVALLMHRNR